MTRAAAKTNPSRRGRNFSFYLFFLVFWLTVMATILMSWQMIQNWWPLEESWFTSSQS